MEAFTPFPNDKNKHKKLKSGSPPNYHINRLNEENLDEVLEEEKIKEKQNEMTNKTNEKNLNNNKVSHIKKMK
eukprot:Pgem_evm1s7677